MADRDRRGGYQPPRRPAPVSNPQSGQRTDGGPGSSRQPIRVAAGGRYGERQALEGQQAAAPLPDATGPVTPPSGGARPQLGTQAPGGVFGPSERPAEPNTVGAGINPLSENPDAALRALYAVLPHPNIWNLIRTERDYR